MGIVSRHKRVFQLSMQNYVWNVCDLGIQCIFVSFKTRVQVAYYELVTMLLPINI
jgi:hypothetical protein